MRDGLAIFAGSVAAREIGRVEKLPLRRRDGAMDAAWSDSFRAGRERDGEAVRNNFLGVLPLIRDYFAGVSPDFYQSVDRRYYPVARGLMVPFDPPMIYGVGGQLYFPWFSFWRQNPLARERLSLFATLVDEVLLQDPDLETARFEILDFSATNGTRELAVIDARDIPRVDDARKVQMLATFAEGFFQAQAELRGMPEPDTGEAEQKTDPTQPGFFDDVP